MELTGVLQNRVFDGSLKMGCVVLENESKKVKKSKKRSIWSRKGGYVGPGRRVRGEGAGAAYLRPPDPGPS